MGSPALQFELANIGQLKLIESLFLSQTVTKPLYFCVMWFKVIFTIFCVKVNNKKTV